jgi:hypothetical protein
MIMLRRHSQAMIYSASGLHSHCINTEDISTSMYVCVVWCIFC